MLEVVRRSCQHTGAGGPLQGSNGKLHRRFGRFEVTLEVVCSLARVFFLRLLSCGLACIPYSMFPGCEV